MQVVDEQLTKMKMRLWDIIASGLPVEHDIDVLRKFILLNSVILVGSFFLCLLSIIAAIEGDSVLAMADFSLFLFLFFLMLILRKRKNRSYRKVLPGARSLPL